MTESFNDKLERVVRARGSHLCVGIDPDRQCSEPMMDAACRIIIAACGEYAAAFKPNAAFFESAGCGGGGAYRVPSIIGEHPSGTPPPLTIFDGKRGDIGNSSACYARGIFDAAGFDATTVNPLMGYDAVAPFLRDPSRGVFLLCLTSNPGAEDFLLKSELYLRIAEKAVEWNRQGNVGLVVGATQATYAAAVRRIAPDLSLLIPGIGAQGGLLGEIIEAIDARSNPRFLINASRSIMQ
ncbi:MAG: orotidine-5'-phosphate decarboxylase, partial [bacterium]